MVVGRGGGRRGPPLVSHGAPCGSPRAPLGARPSSGPCQLGPPTRAPPASAATAAGARPRGGPAAGCPPGPALAGPARTALQGATRARRSRLAPVAPSTRPKLTLEPLLLLGCFLWVEAVLSGAGGGWLRLRLLRRLRWWLLLSVQCKSVVGRRVAVTVSQGARAGPGLNGRPCPDERLWLLQPPWLAVRLVGHRQSAHSKPYQDLSQGYRPLLHGNVLKEGTMSTSPPALSICS